MRNSGKNGDIEHINVAPPDTRFYGYTIVWSAFLIGAVVMAVYFAFGVFLKPILNEFGWSRGLTAGAFSLSWIVQGLLSTVAGRLNDRYGPRQVITACGFIMGITFLLMSQINSAWQLYMLYGVMLGIGLSGVALPLTSTLSKWFIRRRNIMTGIGGRYAGRPIYRR